MLKVARTAKRCSKRQRLLKSYRDRTTANQFNNMTSYDISHHVTVTIKLYLDVGTDEHYVLCSFAGSITSSFKDIERDLWSSPPLSHEAKEKPRLSKVKVFDQRNHAPVELWLILLSSCCWRFKTGCWSKL